jgi:hypothetical protein
VNKKQTIATNSPALARGQLWKMRKAQIRIVDLGKKLVYFRLLRRLGQMRKIRSVALDRMSFFLKTHRARLTEISQR